MLIHTSGNHIAVTVDTKKIHRYRKQSIRLLESAINQMRAGLWTRSEDLLWGTLTLAVKGVALSRGQELDGEDQIRAYASQLGQQGRDRRIRDAFSQLTKFADSVELIRESRFRLDRLVPIIEDVSSAVERLWEMVIVDETVDDAGFEIKE